MGKKKKRYRETLRERKIKEVEDESVIGNNGWELRWFRLGVAFSLFMTSIR